MSNGSNTTPVSISTEFLTDPFSFVCKFFLLTGNERQKHLAVRVTSWSGQILPMSLQTSFYILSFLGVHITSRQTATHKAVRGP